MAVYAEESIFELDTIYINGGKRGFLVGIKPEDIGKAVDLVKVHVALAP